MEGIEMTKVMLDLIFSLQDGRSHATCFLPDGAMRVIKDVFGEENVCLTVSDFTYVSVKSGTVPIID